MKMGLRVSVLLRKTKINDVGLLASLANTHRKIGGLDITVNEMTRVDMLYMRKLQHCRIQSSTE
jgi:hypothetical protein